MTYRPLRLGDVVSSQGEQGIICEASGDVFVNSQPIATIGAKLLSIKTGHCSSEIPFGISGILVNGRSVAPQHPVTTSQTLAAARSNVLIGGPTISESGTNAASNGQDDWLTEKIRVLDSAGTAIPYHPFHVRFANGKSFVGITNGAGLYDLRYPRNLHPLSLNFTTGSSPND